MDNIQEEHICRITAGNDHFICIQFRVYSKFGTAAIKRSFRIATNIVMYGKYLKGWGSNVFDVPVLGGRR